MFEWSQVLKGKEMRGFRYCGLQEIYQNPTVGSLSLHSFLYSNHRSRRASIILNPVNKSNKNPSSFAAYCTALWCSGRCGSATDLSWGTANQYSFFLPSWAYCCMEALALETKVFFMGFPTLKHRNLWERCFFFSADPVTDANTKSHLHSSIKLAD